MPTKTHKTTRANPWLPAIAAIAFLSAVFAGASPNASAASTGRTLSEISAHNSTSDCWLIVDNMAYNVTAYIPFHPGGPGAITPYCGGNATAAFTNLPHSQNAASLLAAYYVGDVIADVSATDTIPPAITIVAPANMTYITSTIPLNYAVSDNGSGVNISACNYVLDLGAATPLPNCANRTLYSLANGTHTLTIYSGDNAGNRNNASVSFTVNVSAAVPPTNSTDEHEHHSPHKAKHHKNHEKDDDEHDGMENESGGEHESPMRHNETEISERIEQHARDVLDMRITKLHERSTNENDD